MGLLWIKLDSGVLFFAFVFPLSYGQVCLEMRETVPHLLKLAARKCLGDGKLCWNGDRRVLRNHETCALAFVTHNRETREHRNCPVCHRVPRKNAHTNYRARHIGRMFAIYLAMHVVPLGSDQRNITDFKVTMMLRLSPLPLAADIRRRIAVRKPCDTALACHIADSAYQNDDVRQIRLSKPIATGPYSTYL